MEFPDHPLWDFSLDVYARPGVEPACLALQDDHGADINVLLALIWAGAQGVRLTAADLDRLVGGVADWHTKVVRPLRAVRRDMKTGLGAPAPMADKLRAEIKRLELDAEHLGQLMLAQTLPGGGAPPAAESALAAACANAVAYFERLGGPAGEPLAEPLSALLGGAFPDLPAESIQISIRNPQ